MTNGQWQTEVLANLMYDWMFRGGGDSGRGSVFAIIIMIAVIPIMIYLNVKPTVQLLWMVPLGMLLSTILAIGVGMLVAPLNAISQDVQHLFRFIVRAGFFVSPVMWTWDMAVERGWAAEVVVWNPMVFPITLARDGFLGRVTEFPLNGVTISIGWGFLMWVIGSALFNKYEHSAVKYL